MSGAAERSRIAAVKASMKVLDTAVEMYAAEHDGLLPCQASNGSFDAYFGKRLRIMTAADGGVIGARFGPYLRDLPANPYSGRTTVRLDGVAAGADLAGWRFDTVARRVQADDPVGATITYEAITIVSGGGVVVAAMLADGELMDQNAAAVSGLE